MLQLRRRKHRINLLDLIPERTHEWITNEEGKVKILVPKYGKNAVGAWLARHLQQPYIYIQLDHIGSAVWLACDGNSTVNQIGRQLQQKFGEEIEPVYDRLGLFFKQLEQNKFIKWKNLP
ncbi:MAG: PqqD family protein [candidate division KSB1 bacterium]|nr:PqqD family protein [candidate division KSB1 bacterium]MDQ7066046.1 PqqD family protein [candidate division KSB1 bacterium]